jgi:hypothetical protein
MRGAPRGCSIFESSGFHFACRPRSHSTIESLSWYANHRITRAGSLRAPPDEKHQNAFCSDSRSSRPEKLGRFVGNPSAFPPSLHFPPGARDRRPRVTATRILGFIFLSNFGGPRSPDSYASEGNLFVWRAVQRVSICEFLPFTSFGGAPDSLDEPRVVKGVFKAGRVVGARV